MKRIYIFRANVSDPYEFAKLINILVQDLYEDGVPSTNTIADYLMADDEVLHD